MSKLFPYKPFIEHYFRIKDRNGQIIPFKFNPIQNMYYEQLKLDYPDGLHGVRENIVKSRKLGMSSIWEAIYTVDFIMGTIGKGPIISSQIVSHKSEETKPHFQRVNMFLDSYLEIEDVDRKIFLNTDNQTSYLKSARGLEIFIGTAGAKTLGRGGDLHNLLWTEIAFYPNTPIINAEDLVTGAEREVPSSQGKIIRESTGNVVGDFFYNEWYRGMSEWSDKAAREQSNFHSRFFAWFLFPENVKTCPIGFKDFLPDELEMRARFGLTSDQLYWYHTERKGVKDPNKWRREQPNEPMDSFLTSGSCFFDVPTLRWYLEHAKAQIQEGYLAPDGMFI